MNKYNLLIALLLSLSFLLSASFAESSFQRDPSEGSSSTSQCEMPTDQELLIEREPTPPESHRPSRLWQEGQMR